jgi:hypothetical protein
MSEVVQTGGSLPARSYMVALTPGDAAAMARV